MEHVLETRKLLIVEDDEDIREILVEIARELEIDCKSASDGEEALQLFSEEKFQAVLSDIRMPRMDGIELLTEIKKLDFDIPFVFLTGQEDKDSVLKALRLGVQDFINKPINEKLLKDVLIRITEIGVRQNRIESNLNHKETHEPHLIQKEKRMISLLHLKGALSKDKRSRK